ncbi:unnamed protein product [Scytosiphon promiscuus]
MDIESLDHLQRLVGSNDTLIASCFSGSDDSVSKIKSDELAVHSLASLLCRVDFNKVSAADLAIPVDAKAGAPRDEQGGGEIWWLFFSGGKRVYTARGSGTSVPKLARLAALLERSPATLEQLARQDDVSRKQHAADAVAALAKGGADPTPGGDGSEQEREQNGAHIGGDAASGRTGSVSAAESGAGSAVLIFIAGDRSQVGKSSTCLGLLGALLRQPGLGPGDLAYIKPATQCEKPQLVTEWCEAKGVACRGIGPVVFYKGFTREFLKGGAGTSEDLLQEIRDAVEELSFGRKVVVVDGVGYPAVGSICGVSNGDVAAALKAPVLLVGKSGVGDAVDSYNLNACFFEARGVRVLGGVFNRISTTGYYSVERCREAVTSYFSQANPNALPYGFVPEIAALKTSKAGAAAEKTAEISPAPANPAPAVSPEAAGVSAELGAGVRDVIVAADEAASNAMVVTSGSGSAEGGVAQEGQVEKPVIPTPPPPPPPQLHQEEQGLMLTEVESEEDVEAFLTAAGPSRLVLVDFGAEWCKNCQGMLPFVHGLPERFGGAVAVATADVDESPELADAHDVTAIPHFSLLRNGVQVDTYSGSSENELLSKLTELLPSEGSQLESASPDNGRSLVAGSDDRGSGDRGVGHEMAGGGHKKTDAEREHGEQVGGHRSVALDAAEALIDAFDEHVDVDRLLRDIREHATTTHRGTGSIDRSGLPPKAQTAPQGPTVDGGPATRATPAAEDATADVEQPQGGGGAQRGREEAAVLEGATASKATARAARKSREEVEAEAAKEGASGG